MISDLPKAHLVRGYLNVAPDLKYDAGVVDTFLHGREHDYTVEGCIDFVESAGLVFQDWLDKDPYHVNDNLGQTDDVYAALTALPERTLWSVMDRLRTTNGCHSFIACLPNRPKECYAIDFSTLAALDYVPQLRIGCGVSDKDVYLPTWRWDLNATALAFAKQIDGRRTIREIASRVRQSGTGPQSVAAIEKYARRVFQSMWRHDFVAIARDHVSAT
jgi:hypothetical protein